MHKKNSMDLSNDVFMEILNITIIFLVTNVNITIDNKIKQYT